LELLAERPQPGLAGQQRVVPRRGARGEVADQAVEGDLLLDLARYSIRRNAASLCLEARKITKLEPPASETPG
jgi:hypothetical protein